MTIDIPRDTELGVGPSQRQIAWYLIIRVMVIFLFLGGSIVYRLQGGLVDAYPRLVYLYTLVGAGCLQSLVAGMSLSRVRHRKIFLQIQIVWDLLFVASLVYVSGGIESLFPSLFILVIICAAFFLDRYEIYIVASAAAILYGSLLDLQYYGYLPLLGGVNFPKSVDGQAVFFAVFVNVSSFFLTAFLGGTLSERLRRSAQALKRIEIDYEELGKLNRTILANISSGLMIINPQGRIRSFNVAASKLTGYSLEDVYNQEIGQLFPGMQAFDGNDLLPVNRGEGRFSNSSGKPLILGYSSTLVRDHSEQTIGLLITFQDLTAFKELQEQLQRSDRLAAIGRLASGMAHEIRNPLASISGSVQLLVEGGGEDESRRLMGIVVKEVDRLNGLLTDFLDYAKPSPPRIETSDVSALFDELADVVAGDRRFAGIEICREYFPGVYLSIDLQQFRQALWNLVLNAAEAMTTGGRLYLGIAEDGSRIYVEDTGTGIPSDLESKIFEPFFTTKDFGTGLGLASVFAIVEAHGFRIEVGQGRRGGAKFTIVLAG